MARFYGSMSGNRGEATRMGTTDSGMTAHVRGWSLGVRVDARDSTEADSFDVHVTSGSNGGAADRALARVTETEDGCTVSIFDPTSGETLRTIQLGR